VLVAGVAQAVFQLPSLHRDGFRYRWVSPWKNETVQLVVRRMIPGTLGVAAFQINVLLTQVIAFRVDPQIIASFDYAVRLMELPQGMFGISLATFLLPALAGMAAEKKYSEFRSTVGHSLGVLLLVNLIASVLLVVLAEPTIRLLFERGQFTADSTARATIALMCLAPGLVAFSTVNILARAFYALGDTSTPMKISVACFAMNLVFALALIPTLRQGGMGIANTVTSICNAALLGFALKKRLGRLDLSEVRTSFPTLALATGVAGIAAWAGYRYWDHWFGHATVWARIGAVFIPGAIGGLLYWTIAVLARVPAAQEIMGVIREKLGKGSEERG
jgi:putative peptidoglycan lipid II flippase